MSENKSKRISGSDEGVQDERSLFVPHLEEFSEQLESLEGERDEYAFLLETICGATDDSQAVEQYNGTLGVTTAFVAAHQSAACQVQWNANLASIYTSPGNVSGVRWGSGTMIADDLFLTCGHLFDQTGGGWERPRVNGTTNIISPQEIARNMRLNFNFQIDAAGVLRAEQSFPITELLEYRLGGLDMAVCRIGGNPGATFGRTAVSTTDAAAPEMICIIGHPAGQPKRIEAGPTTAVDGNLIRYNDIDTLGGNSGSGILRASDGRLVGVHTNGGCTSGSPAAGGSNFGQRIAAVIAASPTLQRLTRPKLKILDDPLSTIKFRDDTPKLKLLDDPIKLKVRDDPLKLKVLDDPIGTIKIRDDIKNKRFDDVKLPALDKQPGFENKAAGFDNKRGLDDPGGFDPGVALQSGEAQPARPFILATPHHYGAGSEAAQARAGLAELEAALAQYEQAMMTAEAELQQLDADYRALLAHYEALQSSGQG